jgi:predicted transcriptional regulator
MPFAIKNASNQKYSIDRSKDKYTSKTDRLLNILFYSDELPNDLYTQMNLSHDYYRYLIHTLISSNLIKKIYNDDRIGYILTSNGWKLTRQVNYLKYRDCLNDGRDKHHNKGKYRNRKRQFAYLYALFDRAGIPYESFAKPNLDDKTVYNSQNIYFYSALEFKRLLDIESTVFRGSRVLGFLIGKGKIIPVYRTNQLLKSFNSHEKMVPYSINRYFSVEVDTAILICNDNEAAKNIANQIVQKESASDIYDIGTIYYKNFNVLTSSDDFMSHLDDLYIDHRKTEEALINQYNVNTSKRNERGNLRYLFGTGFIDNIYPILICPGNINVAKAKHFIIHSERKKGISSYIVCKERDLELVQSITQGYPIKIMIIQ